jgi:hypothetical protein
MMIDQQRVDFPAAKLRVSNSDGKVTALLFSDDPRDAIDEKYTGNSFYFEMDLDIADPTEIAQAGWHFTAESNDRADTPYGVFLEGHRRQLQPLDVKVDFDAVEGNPNLTTVWMSGKFLVIEVQDAGAAAGGSGNAPAPPRTVSLAARLIAQTTIKK